MSLVKYGAKVLKEEEIIEFLSRLITYIYYNYFINYFKRTLKNLALISKEPRPPN